MLSLDDSSLDGIDDEALPPPADFFPGDRVADRYRLEVLLGEGAMGTVWRAHDEDLDREVAIKTVHPQLREHAGEALVKRILNEARITASLDDPGIVRVLDVGRTERSVYVVMELLEGPTLETWMHERGRIAPFETVRVILPLLRALDVAHREGVIHRDVKPGNVMMVPQPDGTTQPKLLDFGIARRVDDDTRLTATGQLVGTPLYMSYEQAAGREADHRSDLWAVASIAFEMIAGEAPYEADNYHAVLRRILMSDRAPVHHQPRIDRELAAHLERGLAADPADRWQSAADFAAALAEWLRHRRGVTSIDGARIDEVTRSAHGFAAPSSSAPPLPVARHAFETGTTMLGVGPSPSSAPTEALPLRSLPRPRARRRGLALGAAFVAGVGLLLAAAWPASAPVASPVEAAVATDAAPPPRRPAAWAQDAVAATSAPAEDAPEPTSDDDEPPAALRRPAPSATPSATPAPESDPVVTRRAVGGAMPLPSQIRF